MTTLLTSVVGLPTNLKLRSGPGCVSALTGLSYRFVLDAFKEIRWKQNRDARILSVTDDEMTTVFQRLGRKLVPLPVDWKEPEPSLASWTDSRIPWVKSRPVLVALADGSYVALCYRAAFDGTKPELVWPKRMKGRRKKVRAAWVVARSDAEIEVPNQVSVAVFDKLSEEEPPAMPKALIEAREARTEVLRMAAKLGLTVRQGGKKQSAWVAADAPTGKRVMLWGPNPMAAASLATQGVRRWFEMRDRLRAIRPQDILERP